MKRTAEQKKVLFGRYSLFNPWKKLLFYFFSLITIIFVWIFFPDHFPPFPCLKYRKSMYWISNFCNRTPSPATFGGKYSRTNGCKKCPFPRNSAIITFHGEYWWNNVFGADKLVKYLHICTVVKKTFSPCPLHKGGGWGGLNLFLSSFSFLF